MIRSFFQKMFHELKKKIDLSFLNPASILILVVAVFIALHFLIADVVFKEARVAENEARHDLTRIRPFTSLVVLNRRIYKECKRKDKEPAVFPGYRVFHSKIHF